MSEDAPITVTRDEQAGHYAIRVGDAVAGVAEFRPDGQGRMRYTHTEIDPAFGGRGLGSRLVAAAMADAAARGETVVPLCPFVAGYLQRTEVPGLAVVWPEAPAGEER